MFVVAGRVSRPDAQAAASKCRRIASVTGRCCQPGSNMAKNTRLPLLRLSSRALSLCPSSLSMSAHGIVNLPATILMATPESSTETTEERRIHQAIAAVVNVHHFDGRLRERSNRLSGRLQSC